MLHGEFEHEDSTGGKGRMKAGDVQWMKTGSGIIHSEMPAMKEGKLHGFQLWINMPAKLKMSKPEYIYLDSKQMQVHKDSEKKIKIIPINIGGENISKSKKFFDELLIEELQVFVGDGAGIAKNLKLRGLPTTLFIDKDGYEFARIVGSIDFNSDEFLNWLNELN